MNYPKTLAAAQKVKKSEWVLADALLEEIGPRGSEVRFRECQVELAEQGIDYTARYLVDLRDAARAFPPSARAGWLTPRLASSAGSPAIVEKALDWAEEESEETGEEVPVTQRLLAKVKRAETHHARQETGKRQMPTRDRDRVTRDRPVSETRRTVNVLQLVNLASDAAGRGRTFVEKIAGQEITDRERADLEAYVQDSIDTWKAALSAVRNPLSKSVERFLEEVAE